MKSAPGAGNVVPSPVRVLEKGYPVRVELTICEVFMSDLHHDEATVAELSDDTSVACPGLRSDNVDGCVVERDYKERVTRARFACGNWAQFRYDAADRLYAFIYAGLAWSTRDGSLWTARDADSDYRIDAEITVESDGSLHIAKEDVTRIIKLSGARLDEFKNGSRLESRRLRREASPADLLASSKPISASWQKSASRSSGEGAGGKESTLNSADGAPEVNTRMPKLSGELGVALALPQKLRQETPRKGDSCYVMASAPEAIDVQESPPVEAKAHAERLRSFEAISASASSALPERVQAALVEAVSRVCLFILQATKGANFPGQLRHLDALAYIYHRRRRLDLAEEMYRRALAIRQSSLGVRHPEVAISLSGLASIFHEHGNYARAEEFYNQASELLDLGFRKSLFLQEAGACPDGLVAACLGKKLEGLIALAALYDERKKYHLLEDLYSQATAAWALVPEKDKVSLLSLMDRLRALCRSASLKKTWSVAGVAAAGGSDLPVFGKIGAEDASTIFAPLATTRADGRP